MLESCSSAEIAASTAAQLTWCCRHDRVVPRYVLAAKSPNSLRSDDVLVDGIPASNCDVPIGVSAELGGPLDDSQAAVSFWFGAS